MWASVAEGNEARNDLFSSTTALSGAGPLTPRVSHAAAGAVRPPSTARPAAGLLSAPASRCRKPRPPLRRTRWPGLHHPPPLQFPASDLWPPSLIVVPQAKELESGRDPSGGTRVPHRPTFLCGRVVSPPLSLSLAHVRLLLAIDREVAADACEPGRRRGCSGTRKARGGEPEAASAGCAIRAWLLLEAAARTPFRILFLSTVSSLKFYFVFFLAGTNGTPTLFVAFSSPSTHTPQEDAAGPSPTRWTVEHGDGREGQQGGSGVDGEARADVARVPAEVLGMSSMPRRGRGGIDADGGAAVSISSEKTMVGGAAAWENLLQAAPAD